MIASVPRLLIVEDNPGDVHLIVMALEENGMQVELSIAADGLIAQEMLSRRAASGDLPDLVLLDLNMPRVGGLEVLRFIGNRPKLADVAVVVMTTSNLPHQQKECLDLGAREFLTKPADFSDLVFMIKGLASYLSAPVARSAATVADDPGSAIVDRLIPGGGSTVAVVRSMDSVDAMLDGGGDMGALMRSIDWSRTPVGPIGQWPSSLRTVVRMMMASRHPIFVWWGPELIQFYNDGYRPILGSTMHPTAMGQRGRECWREVWTVIEPMILAVMDRGESTSVKGGLLCLDRNGYLEEGYFDYAYSPIIDESGAVGGIFAACSEITEGVIGRRRERTIRDLNILGLRTQAIDELWRYFTEVIAANRHDLQFCALYLVDDQVATLTLATGVSSGAPPTIDLTAVSPPWSLTEVVRTSEACFCQGAALPAVQATGGPWPEPAIDVLTIPLIARVGERPLGFLVTGLNPRRPLDDAYRGFLDVVAGRIVSAVVTIRAYEHERKRTDVLAEINQAKTAFFANVSHEFRTPLTLMLGPIEEVLGDRSWPVDQRHRERLETSQRSALRLLKLVNTLLGFSRLEAGRAQVTYRPTEIAKMTGDLAGVFRSMIEKAGLTLEVDCPAIVDPVYVDHDMWEKIVLNLMSNAFKFTHAGCITVRLRQIGPAVALTVSDTGIGIPAAELPLVFDRFHRVANARGRSQEGTGIGLALVSDLVGFHGGTVTVASEEASGTTFTVSIPVGKDHLPADRMKGTVELTVLGAEPYLAEARGWFPDAETAMEDAARSVLAMSHNLSEREVAQRSEECVLVVDDNADMRSYLIRQLSPRWNVVSAGDGEAALALARKDPPDLVLSDVMMPGLDGFALLAALRADQRTADIPVILLSARAGEEAEIEGLAAGPDDYIVKPFNARELIARIATHLALRRQRRLASTREQDLRAELALSNADLAQFAAVASHDLQEPLRMVSQYLELLRRKHQADLVPEALTYLRFACDGAKRMSRLIVALLEYAKIGAYRREFTRVFMATIASEVIEILSHAISDARARVEVDILPEVLGDRTLLSQILQNLVANALKYRSSEPPAIRLSATRIGEQWIISVDDNGIGIAPDDQDRLFKVFGRLHAENEIPGVGIGLATCKRFVELQGGQIWVDSVPGEGSTFSFAIPAAPVISI